MTYPLSYFINLPELHLSSEILKPEPFRLSQVILPTDATVELPDIILGKQAEFLFSETIKTASNFSVISENLQINQDKITVGELDYLIKDHDTNKTFHVELACKFYLLKKDEHQILEGQWIGPNLKDTLLDKVTKFKEHQFPLLTHVATKEILSGFKVSEVIKQLYCIKAKLFVPENTAINLPDSYKNCVAGVWKKYKNLILNDNALYAIPTKREWLLPVDNIEDWYSSNDISAMIAEQIAHKKSPLIYEKNGDCMLTYFVVWW